MKVKICSECHRSCFEGLWIANPKLCKQCAIRLKALNTALSPVKTRTTISKVSDKRKKLDVLYTISSTQFKKDNDYCQAQLDGCLIYTTHVHHLHSGASRLKYYLDSTTWRSVCVSCHDKIHNSMGKEQLIKLDLKRME